MKDIITVANLETFGNHGVFPEENVLGQKFIVTAELHTTTSHAGKTDDLTKSIHYGEVSHEINNFMRDHTFKLIESVAENLAKHLLLTFPLIEKIVIEVKKPWAPIGLPLEYASVKIQRKWQTAYIALGSNMGKTETYLTTAIEQVNQLPECQVTNVSEFIRTKPYGGVEQDDFLNGCMEVKTLFTPEELLAALHVVEQAAGRERIVKWGPRTLDLDILLYEDCIMSTAELTIPHIDMTNRDFVLIPLAEIAPYAIHPIKKQAIIELKKVLE